MATEQTSGRGLAGATRTRRSAGVRLGRLGGIEVRLDWSLTIIVLLIMVSLATGLFPRWHPQWTPALRWGVALGAALLFLLSVLLHEFAHAVVGRWRGAKVESLTLFVFGGMARFEGEFKRPRDEFLSAIAGPLTSIALGIGATALGAALAPANLWQRGEGAASAEILGTVGPLATLLLWLGPINLLLAFFNLVPGFPLDGGRVLRSALWAATGDQARATTWAAAVGRGFGWLLMIFGLAMAVGFHVPIFGTGTVSGIWLVLIGWFLASAARSSQQHVLIQSALRDVHVSDLMQKPEHVVSAELDVPTLVREHVLPHSQPTFPVQDADGRVVGLVGFSEVSELPRERWSALTVRDVMLPMDKLEKVTPEDSAATAFERLLRDRVEQLPVVDHGEMRGVLRLADLMRWVTLNRAAQAHGA